MAPNSWFRNDTVRIRLLWIGLVTVSLILINDIRYVKSSPIYVVALGCLVNGCIIFIMIIELRKIYKKLRAEKSLD
jgi:hypothetical protein